MNISSYKSVTIRILLLTPLLLIPQNFSGKTKNLPSRFCLHPTNKKESHKRRKVSSKLIALMSLADWQNAPKELYSSSKKQTPNFRGDPLPRPIPAVGLINTYDSVTEATSSATADTLVKRDASGDFAGTTITATTFIGALTGNASSATNFSGNLAGDVTGTQSATVVSSVGGKTATSVANTVDTVAAATPNSTPDTLVLRDNWGGVALSELYSGYTQINGFLTVSGGARFESPEGEGLYIEPDLELEYGATLSMGIPNNTRKITIQTPTSIASDYTLTLPTTAGTNGYALTTNGSGVLEWTDLTTPSGSIVQDGNSFTAAMTIGTNDAYNLNLETDGTNRLTISSTGAVSTTGSLTSGSTLHSTGDFSVNTNKFTVTAISGNTSVGGTLSSAGALTVSSNGANITGDTSINGDITLEDHGGLRLSEYAINGTHAITIYPPISMAADYAITMPDTIGGDGYALTTDEYGNLSWTDLSLPSGIILQGGNIFGEAITIGTNDIRDLNFETAGTTRMTISSSGDLSVNTDKLTVNATTGNTTVGGTLTSEGSLTVSSNGANITGNSTFTGTVSLANQNQLKFYESSLSGIESIALQAPNDLSESYTLTLPSETGNSGYALTTNGSGVLDWSAIPSAASTVLQNGNSFGEEMIIGTNDPLPLSLETNNTTRMTIAWSGGINTMGNLTVGGALSSIDDFTVATDKFTIASATGNTSIAGTLDVSSTATVNGILYPTGGIEAEGTSMGGTGILNIGITDDTDTLNIATGGTSQAINIGNTGDSINIYGTTYYNHVTQLQITDKLITINDGGATASGSNAGLDIEENSTITGYAKTSGDRASWLLKAPASTGIVTITPGSSGFTLNQGLATTSSPTFAGITIATTGASITGNSSVTGTLGISGDLAVNTDKFAVTASSGNTSIGGILTLPEDTQINQASGARLLTVDSTYYNLSLGHNSGNASNTAGYNVAVGYEALTNINASAWKNTCIGYAAGTNITSGVENCSLGYQAYSNGTSGSYNIAIGTNSLPHISDQSYNIGIGFNALSNIATTSVGNKNIGIGTNALGGYSASALESGNIAIGYYAGRSLQEGSGTVSIGTNALYNAYNATNTIAIGNNAGYNASTSSTNANNIYIGGNQVGTNESNTIRIGSWDNGHSNLLTTACYIESPALTVKNPTGAATLHLQDSSAAPTKWSLISGNGSSTDLIIAQNDTTKITITDAGNTTIGGTLDATSDFVVATDKFTVAAATGNTAIAGTLDVASNFAIATNKFTITAATGNTNIGGTCNITGDFAVATNKFTITAATGNTNIGGTCNITGDFAVATNKLTVSSTTGNTAVAGTLSTTNDFAINTNKFTVAAATGNTAVAGTLSTTSDFAINTNKFTVTASSGNTSIAGDLTIPVTTNTVGAIKAGSDLLLHTYNTNSNLFVGHAAGNRSGTGASNTGCGYAALHTFGTGGANTAVGYAALEDLSSGSYNTAVGSQTLTNLTTGQYNTAVGDQAMTGIVTGSENIALAHRALEDVTSGIRNISIGNASLSNVTTGSYNTAIGHVSGSNLGTGGNYNIYLGYRQLGSSGDSGITRIGSFTDIGANATSKCFVQGIRDVTTDSSDREVIGIDASHQLGTEGAMKVGSSGYLPAVPLPSANTPRILYGRVSSTGSKINGSDGWTVSRTSDPGQYRITFSSSFSAVPTAVATIGDQPISNNFMIQAVNESTSSVDIYIFVPGVAFYNNAFNFQIIGY